MALASPELTLERGKRGAQNGRERASNAYLSGASGGMLNQGEARGIEVFGRDRDWMTQERLLDE